MSTTRMQDQVEVEQELGVPAAGVQRSGAVAVAIDAAGGSGTARRLQHDRESAATQAP